MRFSLLSDPPHLGRFLAATALLGLGQQLFVVARNPWLVEHGYLPHQVAPVQGVGALAGIAAGFLAALVASRVTSVALLRLCGIIQAAGFAMQVAFVDDAQLLLVGAAVAGLGIQLQTAVAPAWLSQATPPRHLAGAFSAWNVALFPLAGLLAAVCIGVVSLSSDGERHTQTLALSLGAALSLAATWPLWWVRTPESDARPTRRLAAPGRAAALVAVFALLGLAGGITVPFFQLYFKMAWGVAPAGIAGLYAASMTVALLGYLAAPRVAARFGLWPSAVGALVLALPCYATMAWAPGLTWAAVGFVGRAASARVSASLLQHLGQEVSPRGDGSSVAALAVLVQSATWAAGAFLAGPLLASGAGGFGRLFVVTALVDGTAILVALLTFPRLWRSRPSGADALGPL